MIKKTRVSTKTRPSVKKPAKAAPPQAFVDYPQQEEGIASAEYTFRIGASAPAEKAEVSIDRGPWLPCRAWGGYWWYDWKNFTPGVHRVTARVLTAGGESGVSTLRRFQVLG